MKVLILAYTLAILRLCSCGDEDKANDPVNGQTGGNLRANFTLNDPSTLTQSIQQLSPQDGHITVAQPLKDEAPYEETVEVELRDEEVVEEDDQNANDGDHNDHYGGDMDGGRNAHNGHSMESSGSQEDYSHADEWTSGPSDGDLATQGPEEFTDGNGEQDASFEGGIEVADDLTLEESTDSVPFPESNEDASPGVNLTENVHEDAPENGPQDVHPHPDYASEEDSAKESPVETSTVDAGTGEMEDVPVQSEDFMEVGADQNVDTTANNGPERSEGGEDDASDQDDSGEEEDSDENEQDDGSDVESDEGQDSDEEVDESGEAFVHGVDDEPLEASTLGHDGEETLEAVHEETSEHADLQQEEVIQEEVVIQEEDIEDSHHDSTLVEEVTPTSELADSNETSLEEVILLSEDVDDAEVEESVTADVTPQETQEEESPAPVEQTQDASSESPVEPSEVLDSTTSQLDEPSSENVDSENLPNDVTEDSTEVVAEGNALNELVADDAPQQDDMQETVSSEEDNDSSEEDDDSDDSSSEEENAEPEVTEDAEVVSEEDALDSKEAPSEHPNDPTHDGDSSDQEDDTTVHDDEPPQNDDTLLLANPTTLSSIRTSSKDEKYASLTTPVTLDILAEVDEEVVDLEKESRGGTTCFKFCPKDGHYFDKVVAGTVTIWDSSLFQNKDAKCTFVHHRRIKPERVVRVFLRTEKNTEKLYYVEAKYNTDETIFKTITAQEYESKVHNAQETAGHTVTPHQPSLVSTDETEDEADDMEGT